MFEIFFSFDSVAACLCFKHIVVVFFLHIFNFKAGATILEFETVLRCQIYFAMSQTAQNLISLLAWQRRINFSNDSDIGVFFMFLVMI